GTLLSYTYVLDQQMFHQPHHVAEADPMTIAAWRGHSSGGADDDTPSPRQPIGEIFRPHRAEILLRILLLVITVIPVIILAQHMAALLYDGLGFKTLPIELYIVLIADLVFLP